MNQEEIDKLFEAMKKADKKYILECAEVECDVTDFYEREDEIYKKIVEKIEKSDWQYFLTYKESKEYIVTDSDIRIIDIILNPVKPELWLDPSIDDFYKFDNSKDMKHAKVKNYKHMGKLPFKVTQ